jgi:Ribosomal protein S3AE
MAAQKRSKGNAGRKVKDKWKAKEWYNVHAPKMFNEMVIGETPAADPELLIGRTTEVTVQDLTGDFSKMHIKFKFKITGTDGHEARTAFVGHDLTSDYVRRLTRRKKTKTDHVVDVLTFDHYLLRIKTMSIAERRIQSSQEIGMRQAIGVALNEMAKNMTLSDFVKAIISGDLGKDIAKACRVVIPIKRIEIRKTEVLKVGDGEPESIIEEVPVQEAVEATVEEVSEETPVEETVEEVSEEAPVEEASQDAPEEDAPVVKTSKRTKKASEEEVSEEKVSEEE